MKTRSRIPILNSREEQTHSCGDLAVSAIVQCGCGDKTPMMIHSFASKAVCKSCGAVFIIAEIKYSIDERGSGTLSWSAAEIVLPGQDIPGASLVS